MHIRTILLRLLSPLSIFLFLQSITISFGQKVFIYDIGLLDPYFLSSTNNVCQYDVKRKCNNYDRSSAYFYIPSGELIRLLPYTDRQNLNIQYYEFFETDIQNCQSKSLKKLQFDRSKLGLEISHYFGFSDYLGRIYIILRKLNDPNSLFLCRINNIYDDDIQILFPLLPGEDIFDITFIKDRVYIYEFTNDRFIICDTSFNRLGYIENLKYKINNIMTFAYDCDSTTTYAFHCSASKVDLFNTNGNYACSDTMFISKYDFKTNTFTPVCFIKMPDQIWYAWVTSPDEFLAGDPECDLLLDLDRDNSSGLYPYDYRLNKTLCTESSTMISDSDIYLHTSIPLDSVILVVHGILDPGLEILTYNNTIPGLSLRKINDSTYILKGPRNTPDSSYRAALLAIRYEHLTGNRTSGTRRIELQGFSVVKAGVKVSAFINLGSIPNSGIDTTITICSHKKITGLSKMIHGAPGGKWIPGLTGGDDYDSALDLANEYTYITGDTICGMDTAIVTIKRGIGTTPMNLTIDTVLCKGNSFVFGGTTYKDTGKFVSIVRSIQGCDSIIYNLQIKSSNILPIDSKQDKALCAGDTITLSVDPIYQQITWIRGVIALGTQPNIRTSSAGEYIVSGIDKNQCKSTDTILVRLFTKPGINVEDMLGLEFINDRPISINYSGNPVKYTWTPPAGLSCANCAVPNLVDDQDRKYKIEVNNAQNCKANDSLLVTYLRANYFMPNAIKIQTQNIGNNNKFFIQGNVAGSYDLQIFNRWGSVVFTIKDLLINDPSSGWLPSETGSPPGVYVYKVILHTVNGDVLKAGDVTVLD